MMQESGEETVSRTWRVKILDLWKIGQKNYGALAHLKKKMRREKDFHYVPFLFARNYGKVAGMILNALLQML